MTDLAKDRLLPPLWVLLLALVAFSGWILIQLKSLVLLLVVGYCIAYVLNPWLKSLEQRGIPRTRGIFVILGILLIIVFFLAFTAVPTIVKEYEQLSNNFPQYIETAKQKLIPLVERGRELLPDEVFSKYKAQNPTELVSKISGETMSKVFYGVADALLAGYSVTVFILNLILLPFIVFYLSIDFYGIHRGILSLVPFAFRRKVRTIAAEIDALVSAFVKGQLTVGAILACLYMLGFKIIGVELWFLLAVFSGFGNIIPYLGLVVGGLLTSIMALVTFGDFSHLVSVWIVYAIVQGLEGTLITPRIVGERVGLSALVVMLAVIAGATLGGLLGVFLAVPGAAVLKVLGKHFFSWLSYKA